MTEGGEYPPAFLILSPAQTGWQQILLVNSLDQSGYAFVEEIESTLILSAIVALKIVTIVPRYHPQG